MANQSKKDRSGPAESSRRDARPASYPAVLPEATTNFRIIWAISFALLLLISLVFFRVAGFDFVSLDDPSAAYSNPHVNHGLTAEGVRWALSDYSLFYWQPLTYLSHMAAFQFFGMNAGWHHAINLIIHAANVLLLFLLLLRLSASPWRSAAAAALFAIHPLAVETVAWVTERNNLLSVFFSLLTLVAYIKYVEKMSIHRYLAVVAMFILALMSKPMAVSLPFALLLLDWWPLGRMRGLTWRRLCLEKLPLFAIGLGTALLTISGNAANMATSESLPFYVRLSGALVAYGEYLWMFLWPHPLGVFYQYAIPAMEWTNASIFTLVLGTLGSVSMCKRYPFALWGWLWYLIMLFPVCGIFQVGGQAVADRFTYWPFIGVYVVVVWSAAACIEHWRVRRSIVISICAVILCVLAAASWMQTETWSDSISLYAQALKATGGNEPMHRNLAAELAAEGKLDDAILHYREAVRLDPKRNGIHHALAKLLSTQGKYGEAIEQFSQELRLNPDYLPSLKELGLVYMRQNRLPDAALLFRHVLRISPSDPEMAVIQPLLATIPQRPDAPDPLSPPALAESVLVGLPVNNENGSFFAPAVLWKVAMLLVCVALGFLVSKSCLPAFQIVEQHWSRFSRRTSLLLLLVGCVPLAIRLLLLPVQSIPQPSVHDEFGYLLIADTFADGRLTNLTPAMWQHFVTHYIFFEPTYTAKYPIAEPAFMAAAQVLGLAPWFGVWFSVGLMCSALYWMLGGWLPPKWASLGGIIAAVQFGISSYWMNSYWGGAVAAIGGALVLGALPRIKRAARARDSVLLAVGLLLLSQTRPYEGALLSIPIGVALIYWLFTARAFPAAALLTRVAAPLCAVLAVGFAFTLFYNWRVTGNALEMPYIHHQKIYGTPTPFYFQSPLPEPIALSTDTDLRANYLWQRENYDRRWPLDSWAAASAEKLATLWKFYFPPALTLPLIFLPLIWRKRYLRTPIVAALFVIIGMMFYPFFFPHYGAPILAIFLLLIVQGLRHVRLFEWRGRPVGRFVFHAAFLLLVCTTASEMISPWIEQRKTSRSETLKKLADAGGKHLILIRFSPQHSFHYGWIYNRADIDSSQVVWAREGDSKSNEEIIRYYRDRTVWLLEVDRPQLQLVHYPGTV